MFSKHLLPLALLAVVLFSCSRESKEPLWEPKSHLGSKDYNGGLFPVWITLKEPVENVSSISWRMGSSRIAYRKQAIDTVKKLITADTAFLYWETPPSPFVKIDSIKADTSSWKYDTTYYYRDTISAIVDGLESPPIIIEVKNILPRIKSISIEGISKPGDSILTIAAHPGDKMEITLSLEKPFKNTFYPKITMPRQMGDLKEESKNDTLLVYVYKWTVPNEPITDSSAYLKIEDSGGYGERLYRVNLIVYTEFGSVWIAAEKEIVKYSPTGTEVARINDNFNLISDIAVNSNNGRLYVTDQSKSSFSIYDTYGKLLYKNENLFKAPTGVTVNVVSHLNHYVWVADVKDELAPIYEARLRRFVPTAGDSIHPTATASYEISGPITGLSADQFRRDFIWFAIPESDTVGFVRDVALETEPKFMPNIWNRPSMVSHDIKGAAWVADSSRVVAIDTSGNVLAEIKGFDFVSSVSASKGYVWVSDIEKGKVYRFKQPLTGQNINLTVTNGMAVDGFLAPVSISAFVEDGGAWVVDKGAGMVTRLDSLGNKIAYGTGLKLPNIGKTLQKVE
jgi:DNA-binding beta-propeller fold protein YncE